MRLFQRQVVTGHRFEVPLDVLMHGGAWLAVQTLPGQPIAEDRLRSLGHLELAQHLLFLCEVENENDIPTV